MKYIFIYMHIYITYGFLTQYLSDPHCKKNKRNTPTSESTLG